MHSFRQFPERSTHKHFFPGIGCQKVEKLLQYKTAWLEENEKVPDQTMWPYTRIHGKKIDDI